jgi:hypothetical protein
MCVLIFLMDFFLSLVLSFFFKPPSAGGVLMARFTNPPPRAFGLCDESPAKGVGPRARSDEPLAGARGSSEASESAACGASKTNAND